MQQSDLDGLVALQAQWEAQGPTALLPSS
jgi:hypothetical protein